jgi:hypothetical protein
VFENIGHSIWSCSGFSQAPLAFYKLCSEVYTSVGYRPLESDECVFVRLMIRKQHQVWLRNCQWENDTNIACGNARDSGKWSSLPRLPAWNGSSYFLGKFHADVHADLNFTGDLSWPLGALTIVCLVCLGCMPLPMQSARLRWYTRNEQIDHKKCFHTFTVSHVAINTTLALEFFCGTHPPSLNMCPTAGNTTYAMILIQTHLHQRLEKVSSTRSIRPINL